MIFQKHFLVHGVIGYVNYYISTQPNNEQTSTTNIPGIIVIDRWALVVFTILFFAYQIGTIIWVCLVPLKKRQMLIKKDHEHRKKIASNINEPKDTFHNIVMKATKKFKRPNEVSVLSDADS